MMHQTAFFVVLLLVFLALIILTFWISSPVQVIQVTEGNQKVNSNAQSVILEGPNSGTSALVMQPRSKGTVIRIWNQTPNKITVLNDHIQNSYANVVSIGTSLTGDLLSNQTIRCVNVDGLSQGDLGNGSWQCTEEKSFQ